MLAAAALAEAVEPAAGGQMTAGGTNTNNVFGVTPITAAAALVNAVAFLNRPHTLGSSTSL